LAAAFLARPDIPLLRLPWNALAVVAAAAGGWFDPSIWLVGGVGELVYLLTIASNPGFRQWIDARRLGIAGEDNEEARAAMLRNVGGAARQRYTKLEEKRARLEQLYRSDSDNLMFDSNRDALRKLTWIFLRLLVAQRNLIVGTKSDPAALRTEIAAIEADIADGMETDALRQSREATLRALRVRLENLQQRDNSLAEIESDLGRIEAQLELALEEATLHGRPLAVSANIDLITPMLTNADETTWSAAKEPQ
ncbi:MAG TPA: hypothetical protein VN181_10025, partial [Thermoanaerobaculia bacterium]|nr:hypothetical protein [Thermoanaerobaculia bacterium]